MNPVTEGALIETTLVILAGGTCSPKLEAYTGQTYRALMQLGGTPLYQIVLSELISLPFGEIRVVGPEPLEKRGVICIQPGTTIADSLERGLKDLPTRRALIASGELPLLRQDHLVRWFEACEERRNTAPHVPLFCSTVVDEETCHRELYGVRKTTLRVGDEQFAFGGVHYLSGSPEPVLKILRQLQEQRKSKLRLVLRLAPLVGGELLWRFILSNVYPKKGHYLTLEYLQQQASRILGMRVEAVRSDHGGMAIDVDDVETLRLLERQLMLTGA